MTDEEVVKARDFALAEIVKLSDSYRDMKINKVMSAETARSAFADGTNYFLKMELECTSVCAAPLSPASTCRRGHYKGTNEIIVFEKDDGHYDVRFPPSPHLTFYFPTPLSLIEPPSEFSPFLITRRRGKSFSRRHSQRQIAQIANEEV